MGELKIDRLEGSAAKAHYIEHLLSDVKALEAMLAKGMFANDVIRIGAEQEFCLVDDNWEPSDKAMEVLKAINDDHFTTEIARYNLEVNLDPLVLADTCFSEMHAQLTTLLEKARAKADKEGLKIILTGILPTIDPRHLEIGYMAPIKRYEVLNSIICDLRGDDLYLHLKGVDELNLRHDSILLEGCNTSFQGHLQLNADDFANSYNWAQAIAGPILSVCANSPVLLGRELWQESRIALFTQSVDTRGSTYLPNEYDARVGFGKDWVQGSIVDFYRDSIVEFPSLVTMALNTDSLEELEGGRIPKLKALQLHNGTVYKWNRLCYGITDNKPHVRIENRYLPAGPTTADEIANFMFWVGLMRGRPKTYDNLPKKMNFKDVKSNFYNAARYGNAAQLYWNGTLTPCSELVLHELLPIAYRGLHAMKVSSEDVEKYLGIIEKRTQGKNGARWIVQNLRSLKEKHKTPKALRILTASMYANEQKGYTIDAWQPVRGNEYTPTEAAKTVRLFMNTKLITAGENDSAALVLKMMKWKNIHHVPIVNIKGDLTGLLTWTDVRDHSNDALRLHSRVADIMRTELITITEDTMLADAQALMEKKEINCLPVVEGKKLRGIITTKDL